jgi:hypothetical protein
MLNFTLARSKLLYASIAWNSLNSDARNFQLFRRKFSALCYNRFCFNPNYRYSKALEYLKCRSRLHAIKDVIYTRVFLLMFKCLYSLTFLAEYYWQSRSF